MTITARFASRCPSCSVAIAVGERVEWTKGSKARHTDCSAVAASKAAAEARKAEDLAAREAAFVEARNDFEATHAGHWVAAYAGWRTLDSLSEYDRLGRTTYHTYENEAAARAHCALNEGWDGEIRVRPIQQGDYLADKPVITLASLLPALEQAGLSYLLEGAA